MKINRNTILITGGATGIGYALAEGFLKEDNEIIICGRREQKLLEAQKNHPKMHIKVCDITQEAERIEMLKWVKTHFSGLNMLINNAGIQRDIDFTNRIFESRNL